MTDPGGMVTFIALLLFKRGSLLLRCHAPLFPFTAYQVSFPDHLDTGARVPASKYLD